MRLVLQRVSQASVSVDDQTVGSIGRGYVILLCVMKGDTSLHAQWLAEKLVKLRLFESHEGKVNDRSLLDIGGEVLVVSQFTLAGDIAKGNRPDYMAAAGPDEAKILYEYFMKKLQELRVHKVEGGVFGAMMSVQLTNDGPVTLILEK
ncbi:MAG: D-aminoacyl-tRNA deacylase [Candidatus Peregrinibacteria bacterium]